jgi:hypothetical protein
MSRDELVHTLINWPYVSAPPIGEENYNNFRPSALTEQSFSEVVRAAYAGLIDESLYEEIRSRRKIRGGN